jgi:hypothetical protein
MWTRLRIGGLKRLLAALVEYRSDTHVQQHEPSATMATDNGEESEVPPARIIPCEEERDVIQVCHTGIHAELCSSTI